jgi:VanZ family protein
MTDSSSSAKAFLAVMVVLTAVTWAVGLLDIQYKAVATLAFENGFPGELSDWKPAGDPENITVSANSVRIDRNTDKQSYAMRVFPLPPAQDLAGRHLRVRGTLKTLSRATPIDPKRVAAYMIWFQDENQETIQYLTVQALTGDFPDYRAERIVSVPDNARFFVTALINRDSNGAFELTDADVTLVSTTVLYSLISPAVFAGWLTLLLVAMFWMIRSGSKKLGLSVSALLLLTFVGVLLPESITTLYLLPAYTKLSSILALENTEPMGHLFKVGHFVFFFVLSNVLVLNRQTLRLSASLILSFMLVFALATEGLQLHLFDRSTRLSDIGIDLAGILSGWLIATSLQNLFGSKQALSRSARTFR